MLRKVEAKSSVGGASGSLSTKLGVSASVFLRHRDRTAAVWRRGVLMPWRECPVTEERLRFVARLLEGEGMSEVCRDCGISRKTGYKIFSRYKEAGLDALCDRSRRPVRYTNQLPDQVERLIIDLKRDKPHWRARKIRELLLRKLASGPDMGSCGGEGDRQTRKFGAFRQVRTQSA
jgi:hypothetical protein